MLSLLQNIAENAQKLARVSNVQYSEAVDSYREEVHIYIDNYNTQYIEVVEFGDVVWGLCVKDLTLDDAMKEICNIINNTPTAKAEWFGVCKDFDDDF